MADYMLCIDGMEGDNPLQPFPQENLNAHGIVRTVPEGTTPDSLSCILRLLGAAETEIPAGRAAWEALACGLPIQAGDGVLRCTLCACDADGRLWPAEPARVERHMDAIARTAARLMPDGWTFHRMAGYRGLICVGRSALDALQTVPPHQHFGAHLSACLPRGGQTGERLRRVTAGVAQAVPGYALIPWGQSTYRPLFRFSARAGRSAAMICQTEIVRGLSLALGLDCPVIPGASADVDTDLHAKYQAARQMAQRCPLVLIHVNGCDEAAHRRDAAQKQVFLQRVRQELLEPLLTGLQEGERLLLCSDHQTISETGGHGAEPVHFWIYEGGYAGRCIHYPLQQAGRPLGLLLDRGGR